MKTLLWLDDVRDPHTNDWLVFSPISQPYRVVWLKSYYEFVAFITVSGVPDAICFDHDLGLDMVHVRKFLSKSQLKKFRKSPEYKTGHDCAKWLVNYCLDNNVKLPLWNIQSANTTGKDNINGLLKNFRDFQESDMR